MSLLRSRAVLSADGPRVRVLWRLLRPRLTEEAAKAQEPEVDRLLCSRFVVCVVWLRAGPRQRPPPERARLGACTRGTAVTGNDGTRPGGTRGSGRGGNNPWAPRR